MERSEARRGRSKGKKIFWQEYWGPDVGTLVATVSSWTSHLSSSPSALEKIFLPPNILANSRPPPLSLLRFLPLTLTVPMKDSSRSWRDGLVCFSAPHQHSPQA